MALGTCWNIKNTVINTRDRYNRWLGHREWETTDQRVLARKDSGCRGVSAENKTVLTGRQSGDGQSDDRDQTAHVWVDAGTPSGWKTNNGDQIEHRWALVRTKIRNIKKDNIIRATPTTRHSRKAKPGKLSSGYRPVFTIGHTFRDNSTLIMLPPVRTVWPFERTTCRRQQSGIFFLTIAAKTQPITNNLKI